MPGEGIIKKSLENLRPKEESLEQGQQIKMPDFGLERNFDKLSEENLGEKKAISEKESSVTDSGSSAPSFSANPKKERELQIESFLAIGLEDFYLNMDPARQEKFKIEGEKTAKKINDLLGKAKVNFKKIVDLIRRWLSIIPGVNQFFLEQEAKLRADKIIKLKR